MKTLRDELLNTNETLGSLISFRGDCCWNFTYNGMEDYISVDDHDGENIGILTIDELREEIESLSHFLDLLELEVK